MAHGTKYRIQYYRKGGGLTTIDILQRGYSSTITTLKGGASPFESSFAGDIQNIYAPTLGSGAIISIVSAPLDLLELFTADPQEWMVQVWDGVTDIDSDASSDSGGTLRWQGFINADIYTEGYSNPIVSEKKFNCNDGMALLDSIQYKSTDVYTGKQTIGQIITNVLSKLELSWNLVFTSNDIQITDVDTNSFLYLDLFNENFIDESEEPMTCRQVLESIMGGLGLSMYFEGYNIYVVDPINLHDTSKGKSYNSHTWGSETSVVVVGGWLDISHREIRWGSTGTVLDEVPALNEVIVKYDPYNFTELSYNFAESSNWVDAGTFNIVSGYQLNNTIEYKDWVIDSGNEMQIAMRQTTYSAPEYVLQLSNSGGEASYTFTRGVIMQDLNLNLRVSMDVFVQTKKHSADIFSGGIIKDVNRVQIPFAVKIGDQYWRGGTVWESAVDSSGASRWQPFNVFGSDMAADYLTATINDKWQTVHEDIAIWPEVGSDLLGGEITVEILDSLMNEFDDQIIPITTPFFNNEISDAHTTSFNDSGVTWEVFTDSLIKVTIVGFKTHVGISPEAILNDSAITAITSAALTVVGGTYHDAADNPHNFGSSNANTRYNIVSYTASTDTLIYDISTVGTPYFAGDFDHFAIGYLTDIVYTYSYLIGLYFIKNVKIEIINSWSRVSIGNDGVKETAVLSTNLTGKDGYTINVTSGTGPFGCSRGAFKSSQSTPWAGDNIEGLFRGVDSTIHSNAALLLQSFISQYKQPRFKLNGRLNMFNQPLNIRTKLIKDSHFLGDRAFYIVSGTYIDKEEMMDVEMIEVTDTRETIA